MKENILNETTKEGSRDTSNASNDATQHLLPVVWLDAVMSIYGVAVVAVLAIGACALFAYNKRSSQSSSKEQVRNNL